MEINEFVFWLQGALEMNPEMLDKGMSPQQVKTIQDHLNLVFTKVTLDRFEDVKIPDPNSSGNPPPQHPGSICAVDLGVASGELFCNTFNLGSLPGERMTPKEFRKAYHSPSTGGKVYC